MKNKRYSKRAIALGRKLLAATVKPNRADIAWARREIRKYKAQKATP